jgi:hypothetical protein
MTPDFMKLHLWWMREYYRLYLWDTLILHQKYVDALKKESNKIQRLLGRNSEILLNIVPVDDEKGNY